MYLEGRNHSKLDQTSCLNFFPSRRTLLKNLSLLCVSWQNVAVVNTDVIVTTNINFKKPWPKDFSCDTRPKMSKWTLHNEHLCSSRAWWYSINLLTNKIPIWAQNAYALHMPTHCWKTNIYSHILYIASEILMFHCQSKQHMFHRCATTLCMLYIHILFYGKVNPKLWGLINALNVSHQKIQKQFNDQYHHSKQRCSLFLVSTAAICDWIAPIQISRSKFSPIIQGQWVHVWKREGDVTFLCNYKYSLNALSIEIELFPSAFVSIFKTLPHALPQLNLLLQIK